jgi:hypothetical protein
MKVNSHLHALAALHQAKGSSDTHWASGWMAKKEFRLHLTIIEPVTTENHYTDSAILPRT